MASGWRLPWLWRLWSLPVRAVAVVALVIAWTSLPGAGGRTVVMLPNPATSHTKYHTHVARALGELGHDVWLSLPLYLARTGRLDTTGFRTIHYDTLPRLEERALELFSGKYFEGKEQNIFDFFKFSQEIYEGLLKNETFLRVVGDLNPDLIVIDNLPMLYPLAVIPYRLGKPFAFLGSVYDPLHQRIPFSPADTPVSVLPYGNRMTFWQRLHTAFFFLLYTAMTSTALYPADVVSRHAPEMPPVPLAELLSRAEVWLVELDHVLDYPRATLPNVKLIGGTATGPVRPLPEEFRAFMDGAGSEGVVVVTFGSYVLDLPEHLSQKLFRVFRALPMKVIFRSPLTSPDPDRVMTSDWIPQNDLLGHPSTKVFVSHCGKNGQYEALYHAVPVVALPLFADQPYNAERARSKGFARVLDFNTCTAEELRAAIVAVATEPGFRQAADRYSRLFRQVYGVPTERAAWWLDHVMEHGGGYMRAAGQEMPWYQFLLIDVLLLVAVVALAVLALLAGCVWGLCRWLRRKKSKRD